MQNGGRTTHVLAGSLALALSILTMSVSREEEAFRKERERMVRDQIEWRGVREARVLAAMRSTLRHEFVSPDLHSSAYDDRPLPIGYGQTISQPYIVAKMTELLEPKKDDRLLELGTGSGYQAAVLAPLVREVYTIEIIEPLGNSARERLKRLGYANIWVKVGDGYFGWPEKAPFDAIVVTAAANHVPPALVEQLKPWGRLVIPIGNPFQVQNLMLVVKGKDNRDLKIYNIMPVAFVPLTGGHEQAPRE